jgi:hypothetical protein
MQKASTAMKQIHGGLTIDKVDNVMCVLSIDSSQCAAINIPAGRISESNTQSARKSAKPSPRASPPTASTKTSSMRNLQNCSRRSSTRICSRQATCPSTTQSRRDGYPRRQTRNCRNNNESKRTTKRRSCGSCRQRWPCEPDILRCTRPCVNTWRRRGRTAHCYQLWHLGCGPRCRDLHYAPHARCWIDIPLQFYHFIIESLHLRRQSLLCPLG